MTDAEIQALIDKTVNATIAKLKLSGLMKDNGVTAYQKTEHILRSYPDIKAGYSEDGTAQKFVGIVDNAMHTLLDDLYYDIIPMIYFEKKTREDVAEYFDTSVTTISRHRVRLVNKLKLLLFSDEAVIELFS